MVESCDVVRVKRRAWIRDAVLVEVVHLVEACVVAKCLGAARVYWDTVRTWDAIRPVQVEAGAGDLCSGKVIDTAVIFTSCSTGSREAYRCSGTRPVVVVISYLNPIKPIIALQPDRDGSPCWRCICIDVFVLNLYPAVPKESHLGMSREIVQYESMGRVSMLMQGRHAEQRRWFGITHLE